MSILEKCCWIWDIFFHIVVYYDPVTQKITPGMDWKNYECYLYLLMNSHYKITWHWQLYILSKLTEMFLWSYDNMPITVSSHLYLFIQTKTNLFCAVTLWQCIKSVLVLYRFSCTYCVWYFEMKPTCIVHPCIFYVHIFSLFSVQIGPKCLQKMNKCLNHWLLGSLNWKLIHIIHMMIFFLKVPGVKWK